MALLHLPILLLVASLGCCLRPPAPLLPPQQLILLPSSSPPATWQQLSSQLILDSAATPNASTLVSLGSMQARLRDMPPGLRSKLESAALEILLQPPSFRTHQVLFALGSMGGRLASQSLAALKPVLLRAFPATPRTARHKLVVGMSQVGFRWTSLDCNLRSAMEEQAAAVPSLTTALRRMGAEWSMLQPSTRALLPDRFIEAAPGMTARELSASLLALAEMAPPADLGLVAGLDLQSHLPRMTAWNKGRLARALVLLGAADMVEPLGLKPRRERRPFSPADHLEEKKTLETFAGDEVDVCKLLIATSRIEGPPPAGVLPLLVRRLPVMSSRAVGSVIYTAAKIRYELRRQDAASFAAFADAASEAFFATGMGMAGQGDFCNCFSALAQVHKARSLGPRGHKKYDMDDEVPPLPPLLDAARMQLLEDAFVHHAPRLTARDLSVFAGSLRALTVLWRDLPLGLLATFTARLDECVGDLDEGAVSMLILALGSVGVELKALPVLTRVRLRQQLNAKLPGMSSRELYWSLCGLGRMKAPWADLPQYLQEGLRRAVLRHVTLLGSADGGYSCRAVIALCKGLAAAKASWSKDIEGWADGALSEALTEAVQQVMEQQELDDAAFGNLVMFLRKLELPLAERHPFMLQQVLSRMERLAPLRPNDRRSEADGWKDTSQGRGYDALPALLRELRATGVTFVMLPLPYLDRALAEAAGQVASSRGQTGHRIRLLALLEHTCIELSLLGASWQDLTPSTRELLAAVVYGTPALAEALRLLGHRPLLQQQRQQQSESQLLQKLSSRLPSLSDADLLRAIYLLGLRKFPKELLVGSPVLGIIDARITEMFPEMGPVALVAVLGSLCRLDLRKGDLPLSGGHVLTHISSLASSLDRRTLLAALRGLLQLGFSWQDLAPSQQADLAAGIARAATAKPTGLTSLLQELQRFNLSWSNLHARIPIVLRYVVFHMFTQAASTEREFTSLFLGDGGASSTGEVGGDGSSASGYTLGACGELLVEMVNSGAEWDHLGTKAALAVVTTMNLKAQAGSLSRQEVGALQAFMRTAPPGALEGPQLQQLQLFVT